MKRLSIIAAICGVAILFSSCSASHHTMREPNVRVELTANDFELSDQVVGEAEVVKVFGIDWARLFSTKVGETSGMVNLNIPIVGNLVMDNGSNYAVYDMMQKNPGYDVVVYPQVESHGTNFLFLFSTTNYKVTARLGKLKKK